MNNMKQCPNCSHENGAENLFCEACGAKLVENKTGIPVETTSSSTEETTYQQGLQAFSQGQFDEALALFTSIKEYKDAADKCELVEKTQSKVQANRQKEDYESALGFFSQGQFDAASELFLELGEYADSKAKLQLVNQTRQEAQVRQVEADYLKAIQLTEQGQLAEAQRLFQSVGDYQEAQIYLVQIEQKLEEVFAQEQDQRREKQYQEALENFGRGHLDYAQQQFKSLGDYKDSQDKLAMVTQILNQKESEHTAQVYEQGLTLFSQGHFGEALSVLGSIRHYKDVAEKLVMIEQARQRYLADQAQNERGQALYQAQNAATTQELGPLIDYLQSVGISAQDLTSLQVKYQELEVLEQAQQHNNASKKKRAMIMTGIIIIICLAVGGIGYYRYSETKQLHAAVATQRKLNVKDFGEWQDKEALDEETVQELKEMMTSYGANAKDYTFEVLQKTKDYTLLRYTFKSPDTSLDKLPAAGTRIYKKVAITRVDVISE